MRLGLAVCLKPEAGASSVRPAASSASADFARELANAKEVRFSAHAQKRLASRNLQLNQSQLAGIARATDQAAARGARDSLLLMDDMALVVNVPNRTVVTALDPSRMQNGIVTNIDATVFVSTQ
ncbi:MAG: flagellar biosynthesis protein [Phycisphaerae bacterium]|nr:flagellar biosynthesis protein [Phycisphaerae bacterium]